MKAILKNMDDVETKDFCLFLEKLENRYEVKIPHNVKILDAMYCDLEFDCSLFSIKFQYLNDEGWIEFAYDNLTYETYSIYLRCFKEITFK